MYVFAQTCEFLLSVCLNRFMVGCGRCDDWFHGDCVGLDLAKVQQMEKEDQEYVCLKCCAQEDEKTQASEQSDDKSSAKQKQRPQQSLTAGGIRPFRKVSKHLIRYSKATLLQSKSTKIYAFLIIEIKSCRNTYKGFIILSFSLCLKLLRDYRLLN